MKTTFATLFVLFVPVVLLFPDFVIKFILDVYIYFLIIYHMLIG